MGLRKRRHLRFSVPDVVALVLFALLLVAATLWLRQNLRPQWQTGSARVVECSLPKREYGGATQPEWVQLTYRYVVEGHEYTGFWEGFWPKAHSPNALPPGELDQLRDPGFPLSISYDPGNPSVNSLHQVPDAIQRYYPWVVCGLSLLTLAYFSRVYPQWKRRPWPRG